MQIHRHKLYFIDSVRISTGWVEIHGVVKIIYLTEEENGSLVVGKPQLESVEMSEQYFTREVEE